MSRNATASWSGYAHQGNVGLLVALRKINSLPREGTDLSLYTLDYETQEDAKIVHNGQVLEVHQVKAKGTAIYIGSYTPALLAFQECPGINCLHTICEIVNWADLTPIQNPKNIVRYPYSDTANFCPLGSIENYIDSEIELLLANQGHYEAENEGWRRSGYQEFLARLDEKIRHEHQHHDINTYNISFRLQEIVEIFTAPPSKSLSKIFAIRRGIFDVFIQFLGELDANRINIPEAHEEFIKKAIRQIYELDDHRFIQFLRNINPHTTGGINFSRIERTDQFFVGDAFYSTFLYVMIKVTAVTYTLDIKEIPCYFKGLSYLITSIDSAEIKLQHHAKNILENSDVDFSAYENDLIITQQYEGKLIDHAPKMIDKDSRRVINKKNMSFIKVANAIAKLNR